VKYYWLLPSCLSVFLLSSPAKAARLQGWRLNANQNRLDFKTEGGVQPKAKLIFNPTRLVIDLPGTTLPRPTVDERFNGAISSLRVGQLDDKTTRMVVELSPGYTLDPQQVKFRGASSSQWTVELPTPQRLVSDSPSPNLPPPQPLQRFASNVAPTKIFRVVDPESSSPEPSSSPQQTVVNTIPAVTKDAGIVAGSSSPQQTVVDTTGGLIQVQKVQLTPDGFFVRTLGKGTPEIKVNRSSDRSTINVDITGATLSPLAASEMPVNFEGVSRIQLYQVQTSPPVVRMTLQVNQNSPDWQAKLSPFSGVLVLPSRGIVAATPVNPRPNVQNQQIAPPPAYEPPRVAKIQSVDLSVTGTQLLIRATQPLTYTSGWDRETGFYRITLGNAQLGDDVKQPTVNANSSLLGVRLEQTGSNTVVILVQPAAGVRIGSLDQLDTQLLSLELQRQTTALLPPAETLNPSQNDPALNTQTPPPQTPRVPKESSSMVLVAPPQTPSIFQNDPAASSQPPSQQPRASNGRIIVVIDPGHGGKDSGAIGIGGLQEKNVILPIGQQVAAILEKYGVQAVLTRTSDYFVDLAPRVTMTQRLNADLFVSIHANSIDNRPDVNGLEVYYYDSGLGLAQTIQKNILHNIDEHNRGVRRARFYVLRNNSLPAVLVETGFVTGAEDAPRLASPAYQHQMAVAIAQGILQYINQNF
jgi:N-acetylmuramoyl-L-alanine amidase